MPELPEVHTIVGYLAEGDSKVGGLPGRVVHSVSLLWERTLAKPAPQDFYRMVAGQEVLSVSRRGKFIRIALSQQNLLIHLRMSGDLRVEMENDGANIQKHDRLLINFQDGWRLVFNDTRKFGRVWLLDDPLEVLGCLGPEPLSEQFTKTEFYRSLLEHRRKLKPLLMDQKFLAGMGNIYTDEALHRAGLHPCQVSNQLSPDDANILLSAIKETLQEGINKNGSSIDWVYRGGGFQDLFRVYGRGGKPCLTCGKTIARIIVAQRSTHYCENCQPLKGN